jgi:hypothetical protein
VTYIGGTTLEHGVARGKSPPGTVVLADGEQIISIFGTAAILIRSIGFVTTSGAIYGPWGGPGGGEFSINGPVYGFYGDLCGDILGQLGIWTMDSSTPPSPTPSPNPPGMLRSKMFGGVSLIQNGWDDTSTFAGNPPF